MLALESKKFPLWERVFKEFVLQSSELNGQTTLVFEGEMNQYFTEVTNAGIFRLEDSSHIAILFDYDEEKDSFDNVNFEIEIDIHNLKSVAVVAKDFLESLK